MLKIGSKYVIDQNFSSQSHFDLTRKESLKGSDDDFQFEMIASGSFIPMQANYLCGIHPSTFFWRVGLQTVNTKGTVI